MASIHGDRAKQSGDQASDDLRLLTMAEVAVILRKSRKALYAMLARGQMPTVVRIGRRILIRERDLREWLEERRAKSPTESWR